MVDLDRLEALAELATTGPWEAITYEATMNDRSQWRIGDRSKPQVFSTSMRSADAEFIAAVNPAVILELVKRVRTAEGHIAAGIVADAARIDDVTADTLARLAHIDERLTAIGRGKS